ncbi:MAG: hypothetical protein P8K70_01195 [Flavobacteriaceae bacterium]|nr:hypothetical protein [Flavobacteriaceae bacterium]
MRLNPLYLLIVFFIYSCNFIDKNSSSLNNFIPKDASLIIRIHNPNKFKSDVLNNSLALNVFNNEDNYNFKKQIKIIESLSENNPILICLSGDKKNNSFTIITRQNKTDLEISNDAIYKKIIDSIYIISNSADKIEKSALNKSRLYEKYKNLNSEDASFSVFAQSPFSNNFFESIFGEDFSTINNDLFLKANLFNDKILINGISVINDSVALSKNILKNTKSKENKIISAIPDNFKNFYSMRFDDFQMLNRGYININKDSINVKGKIFDEIVEIAVSEIEENKVVILRSNDIKKTHLKTQKYKSYNNYKGKEILEIPETEKINSLTNPLLSEINPDKLVIIDNFLFISNSLKSLKTVIENYLLKNTYQYSENYKKSKSLMSKESSFDINSKNGSLINFSKLIGIKPVKNKFNNVKFQIVNENEILHINGVIDNYNNESLNKKINKIFSTKIKGKIVMNPHFVTNHITKAKEIVVQDNNNHLYLISNQGKVIWKKKLAGKILGKIKQVDIYKNGRLQLIFVTEKRLYVLDRNGKEVKPFPKVFRDKITQPLSVFNYDNNKNYRFLVTQNNELLMYDSKGKIVKGFKYEKSSDIIYSPKHYRIKNKDIITVKTEKGLKILNRRGKIRIKIKDNIKFSNTDVFRFNNYLICTSEKGNLVQIDMNGSVSTRKLNLSNNHKINSKYNLVSIIDGNKLTNLNKSIDLPFGNYSDPLIFSYNKRKKFSIFDNQSKKIYLFDDKLNLVESFPLYSISNIDLDNIDKDQNLELILAEDESSIRLYEIHN